MSRRTDGPDLASPKAQRSMSMNSDRPSLSGVSAMPSTIHPAPAYVAASAASQIVSDHRIGDGEETDGSDEGALYSEGALASLNAFLDHLLYRFLASAKSTSLADLRPAVIDTLKTKLARDAIATADQDLYDLLQGTEDEEELSHIQNGADVAGKWDLEMVWRRTRLRIMVYSNLGEMEDEDEERYLQEDEYFTSDNRRFSRTSGLVSWAAAIFLTSVIEYMAEQTIACAGKAAYTRSLKRKASDVRSSMETEGPHTRIIVEESDMEKVALDSTLSRLWRTWRRRLRQPSSAASTPAPSRLGNRPASITSQKTRNLSIDGNEDALSEGEDYRTPSSVVDGDAARATKVHEEAPENMPLPMGERDIDEIEVPGLANTFEDEPEQEEEDETPARPASFITLMRSKDDSAAVQDDEADGRPILRRARSRSLPVPGAFSNDGPREPLYERAMISKLEGSSGEAADETDDEHGEKKDEPQNKRKSFLAVGASMAAAGAAAAYATVMGTRKQDDLSTPISPSTDDGKNSQAYEAHSKEIDDVIDAQVLDSRRVSVIRPTDAPELIRHESGSSYSTGKSFSPSSKAQEFSNEKEKEKSQEKRDVSPLQGKEKTVGVPGTTGRPVSPPSPLEQKTSRIPAKPRRSPDADDDARKLERIAKATAPVAAAIAGAGAAAVAARRHPGATSSVSAHPWDEPSAEQFFAAESLQGPSRDKAFSQARRPAENTGSQRSDKHEVLAATPAREKLRKPVAADSRGPAPAKPQDRSTSSDSITKTQALTVKTTEKGTTPAEWSNHVSPAMRRPTRGSKSSIDSLGDQHAQVTPISASSARRRDFDSLVKGEETMKYTLTPQGMRDFENSPLPSATKEAERPKSSKLTKQPQEQVRSAETISSTQQSHDRKQVARSSSVTNKTSSSKTSDIGRPTSRSQSTKAVARPPQKNYLGTKHGLVAREPQVQTVSTKDLADFFQTTAPVKEPDAASSFPLDRSQSQPNTATRKQRGSTGADNDRRDSPTKSVTSPKAGNSPRPTTAKKTNLQARDAVTPASGSSDLIDFIRQGPPPGMNVNQQQAFTPRNTNRDSSTVGTLSSARTSANSRTALMPQQNGNTSPAGSFTQSAKQTLAPPGGSPHLGAGAPDLGKKRYRNKDPYAIDFDDEDDDLLTALPHGGRPKRQEESLIDFLNSVEPPSLNAPKPLFNGTQSNASKGKAEQPNTLKKADPTASKKADVRAQSQASTAAAKKIPGTAPSTMTTISAGSTKVPNRDGLLSTTTQRAPNQILNPLSMNAPNSASASPPQLDYPDISAANRPKPSTSAGVAKGAGSAARLGAFHTDELADFLRSSGPPEGPPGGGAPAPVVSRAKDAKGHNQGQGETGKRRFPWTKKTYLDMP